MTAAYDTIGKGYATRRRPDPRIAAAIETALDGCATIVNVGAGSGSYEIAGRTILAVEPSAVMIAQRPADAARCIQACAEELPVESKAFDAATAFLTLHHWHDVDRGLAEMARVARRRLVILTWIPDGPPFWLTHDYFPEIVAHDAAAFPTADTLIARCRRVAETGYACCRWRNPPATVSMDF